MLINGEGDAIEQWNELGKLLADGDGGVANRSIVGQF
jgi:hypothetical protein